jgi:hypothetical protein
VRAFARLFGGAVSEQDSMVILSMEPSTKEDARAWVENRINRHAPPPAGVVFVAQIVGAP